jgi:hypothetical protein
MDSVQEQHEQGVGDRFAEWLSRTSASPCRFLRRADRAPDLVYSFRGRELLVEITAAYYDSSHAKFLWKTAKAATDAPHGWSGANPDRSLAKAIAECIDQKSKKRYGDNTILLIDIPPSNTSAERLAELLVGQPPPPVTPFVGIFVAGTFPIVYGTPPRTDNSAGGYRVIPIKSMALT